MRAAGEGRQRLIRQGREAISGLEGRHAQQIAEAQRLIDQGRTPRPLQAAGATGFLKHPEQPTLVPQESARAQPVVKKKPFKQPKLHEETGWVQSYKVKEQPKLQSRTDEFQSRIADASVFKPPSPKRPAPRRRAKAPAAPARAPAAAAGPIITVTAPGGGGASSSAGGAAGGAAAGGSAPDMSKVVEAVKQLAEAAKKGKTAKKGEKGITQARKQYTAGRKTKIAELRALKSKRIREHNARTKKLPKAERQKQRRAYKKRVEAQFKEMQQQFPIARGLKSVAVLRELVRKLQAFKTAK